MFRMAVEIGTVRTLLCAAAVGLLLACPAFGQEAPDKADPLKPLLPPAGALPGAAPQPVPSVAPPPALKPLNVFNPPLPANLEEMLTQALKENPDVHVAEARLKEADAELNRVRLQVVQKVVALHQTLDAQRAAAQAAEAEYRRATQLAKTGSLPQDHLVKIEKDLAEAKARLAAVEAELPYLLGRQPLPEARQVILWSGDSGRQVLRLPVARADIISRDGASGLMPADNFLILRIAPPDAAMAARLRKALDTPITVDYKDRPVADLFQEIRKEHGVPYVSQIADAKVTLNLGEHVPLGAALEAVEDSLPDVRIVVRDYGLLVTSQHSLPPGAIRLHDFWKGQAGGEKVPAPPAPKATR